MLEPNPWKTFSILLLFVYIFDVCKNTTLICERVSSSDTDGCTDGWVDGCMDACMHGCTDGCMDGWMDRRMHRWVYGWMDA